MNTTMSTLVGLLLALHGPFAGANPTVEQLAWIVGHWCSDKNGERIEEIWLPAHGGVMPGMGRTLSGEVTSSFEYFRIVTQDHLPSYIAQPGGRPPVTFRHSDGGKHWVRFENPDHDFPKRVEYRRQGRTLYARIAGPGEDGKEIEISFEYTTCRE